MIQLMSKERVFLQTHLESKYMKHGGASIRGIITRRRLKPDTLLMEVPRELWIWELSPGFADLRSTKERLLHQPACSSLGRGEFSDMVAAVGMAREKMMGNETFFQHFLITGRFIHGLLVLKSFATSRL